MTEDDFLAWREHPVTKWVFNAVEIFAEEQKAEWLRASWGTATVDEKVLLVLHTRADAYRSLIESSFADWERPNEFTET